MTATESPPLRLPDIRLSDLPEKTKDFILSRCAATGEPVAEVMRRVLTEAAEKAGFPTDR